VGLLVWSLKKWQKNRKNNPFCDKKEKDTSEEKSRFLMKKHTLFLASISSIL